MADWIHKRKKGVVVMDIERLNNLKLQQYNMMAYSQVRNDFVKLIDAEIARQSATSEEVQEAIERIHCTKWDHDKTWYNTIDLAITALQAYQLTTRKDRTVEEVAISKTETTTPKQYKPVPEIDPNLGQAESEV